MLYAHTKTGPDGKLAPEEEWQTLREHLQAVADAAAAFAAAFGAASLGRIAGLLHDLGKAAALFQQRLRGKKIKVDHSSAGARELLNAWGATAVDRLLARILAYCIAGHHGGLPDCGSYSETGTLQARLDPERPLPDYTAGRKLAPLPSASPLQTLPLRCTKEEAAFSLSFFTRMLFSCLTDADWLDTEQACDPERSAARAPAWPTVDELADRLHRELRARHFLEAAPGKTVPGGMEARLAEILPRRKRIDAARRLILARCLEAAALESGVFSLTVPTGGGKTLSSLAFALEHARRHRLRRVILVVPYTSIIEQNARVFREVLGEDAVLEHHCNFIHPGEVTDEEEGDDSAEALRFRLATENWDATLIVTTAVQFFESLYASRPGRCRKLHNLAHSVVIVDEAQMTPIRLLAPSVAALRELARNYGTSLVLCTATQPALHKTAAFPCGFAPEEIREIMQPDMLPRLFDVFRRVTLVHLGPLDDRSLAEKLAAEPRVLCIVNTRRRARAVFEAVRERLAGKEAVPSGDGLFHLSARMTPAHRSATLDAIRQRLDAGLPCRVVSTSLVECGVDVSFPAVFRELAGLDSIVQAAGRCNRNGEAGEPGRVYVFEPDCGLPRRANDLQRRARLCQDVARRFDDLFSPEAVADFFTQLRDYSDTDEARILDRLHQDNHNSDFPRFAFRDMEQNFRFIPEDDTETVIVENDVPGDPEAAALVRRLEAWDADRAVYRRLQRHSVQVYRHELRLFLAAGSVERLHDRFYVLRGGVGYRSDVGLDADDPLNMDPTDGIF